MNYAPDETQQSDFAAALENYEYAHGILSEARVDALLAIKNAPNAYTLDSRAQALFDVWVLLEHEAAFNDKSSDYQDVICITQDTLEQLFMRHLRQVPHAVIQK